MTERWLSALRTFVLDDLQDLRARGTSRIDLEILVVADLDLGNGRVLPVRGRLDRLVHGPEGVRVGDYKTGRNLQYNLEPKNLVDEAFLRRISHKLRVDNPNQKQFYEIFMAACRAYGVEFNQEVFKYMLRKYYIEANRPLRACHPRDLLLQVKAFCEFHDQPLVLTSKALDVAVKNYFAGL